MNRNKFLSVVSLAGLLGCSSPNNSSSVEEEIPQITQVDYARTFDNSHIVFYGLVLNIGDKDLELIPRVTYNDSGGVHRVNAKLYRHFTNSTGPYLADPILNPEEELWYATDIIEYAKGIRAEWKVDFLPVEK